MDSLLCLPINSAGSSDPGSAELVFSKNIFNESGNTQTVSISVDWSFGIISNYYKSWIEQLNNRYTYFYGSQIANFVYLGKGSDAYVVLTYTRESATSYTTGSISVDENGTSISIPCSKYNSNYIGATSLSLFLYKC